MGKLRTAPADLPDALRRVVDYRKSGLSLNHVVGCPLDCGFCVRHMFGNFDMKRPHLVLGDREAVDLVVGHPAFRAGSTPIQLLNRATDPFLPTVKDHLFAVLGDLDGRGLTNHVLVITRWRIGVEDVARLEALSNIRVTILVTWSGIADERVEPVDGAVAEASLRVLGEHAARTKAILYWRPIVAGLNDSSEHMARARELSRHADATVFSGLFFREEIRAFFRSVGVEDLYGDVARRKILPGETEARLLRSFEGRPIFRKTSCGVAFAHGVPDYNGHFGIREICDVCPERQYRICAAGHARPDLHVVAAMARGVGIDPATIEVDDRRIEVSGSSEQQRYVIQHALNYQVHDRGHPHLPRRHGRAEVGW